MQAVAVGNRVETDESVFAALYPALRRFAAVTGPVDVEPDDLVQEAVARTLRRHRLVDLDDAGAYLRRTIVNIAANQRRSKARWRLAVARLDRTDDTTRDQYASDLDDLLALAPDDRALLYMVEVEGRSYADAAPVLGINEDAARARAARARKRLRAGLEGATDE